jgi:ligand-binding SRPBCC domain-containing protein
VREPIITRSHLNADRAAVWSRVTTAAGINDELRPIFRMTASRSLRQHGLSEVVLGQRICRSWVLLFGVLPVDYDDITLQRLEPPRSFLERPTMLTQREWQHERTIDEAPGGCVLSDRIRYQPRLPIPDVLLRALYTSIFRHRHSRLRKRFGGRALPAAASASEPAPAVGSFASRAR